MDTKWIASIGIIAYVVLKQMVHVYFINDVWGTSLCRWFVYTIL